jgi:hypothetical protein
MFTFRVTAIIITNWSTTELNITFAKKIFIETISALAVVNNNNYHNNSIPLRESQRRIGM